MTETRQQGTRQIPIVCPGHTRPLAELQFLAVSDENTDSRTFLVSACHDKLPMLRDGITGDWIGTFAGHKGAVWCCRLDPTGYLAATASGDFSARVWDAITGASLFTLPHKHIVKTCDFSHDSTRLATGGHEGLLRVYDLTKLKPGDSNVEPALSLPQCDSEKVIISKCTWLDHSTVLAACGDGKIRFWNVTGGNLVRTITVVDNESVAVRDMELSRVMGNDKNKLILTVAAGDSVFFFDLTDGANEEKCLLKLHKMPIHFRDEGGCSLHPHGKKFIAGGSDLWVRVFDFETGEELECHKGHHGPVRCLRYAPNGKTYATGSEDGTIRLWKTDA
eukprot:CAMPEP_0195510290 /NCGR_PEP_ID=MMETSP0794_2-20130614/2974_1 /TAXON_ID=515487 /ORGANISM="Stephanopyxis turris, Strain CCMP 815" /LENGTH=333 /DNA_ID=CAMNT_0040637677 /DNA_START=46 /DNA_END=1047 /DNA_ORIENTATION=+